MLLEINDLKFSYGGAGKKVRSNSAKKSRVASKQSACESAKNSQANVCSDSAKKSRETDTRHATTKPNRATNVLDGVSFSADAGELVALMGPNGVGKSTLFKCVLNFIEGYTGDVLIDGTSTKKMSRAELAKNIAYIPQATRQVFDFTCLELALMGTTATLSAFSNPGRAEEEEAYATMEDLGIAHLANRPSGEISGGEYQLVLLARALLQKAKILLMDEPTANLDYGNQHLVMRRIARLVDAGYLVITSTHDPNQVLLYAHKAVVLQGGHVFLEGAPAEVLTPANLSELYGISINTCELDSARGGIDICYPDFKDCEHV